MDTGRSLPCCQPLTWGHLVCFLVTLEGPASWWSWEIYKGLAKLKQDVTKTSGMEKYRTQFSVLSSPNTPACLWKHQHVLCNPCSALQIIYSERAESTVVGRETSVICCAITLERYFLQVKGRQNSIFLVFNFPPSGLQIPNLRVSLY